MGLSERNIAAAVDNLQNYKCVLPTDIQPDCEMAIEALKKQIEMKPLIKVRTVNTVNRTRFTEIAITEYYCRCFNKLSERLETTVPKKPNYCCRCGQKLNWGDIE